jgi:glycosyltransferase involved in cell wall biosynthesis
MAKSPIPKISVAMAAYNGARWLGAQLDSIVQQSFPVHEIMIVDDGSTDGSVELINQYRQKYPHIQLYVNSCNLGSSKSFERAISLTTGQIIFLADQDDIWLSEKVARHMHRHAKHPESFLIFSDLELIDENERPIAISSKKPALPSTHRDFVALLLRQNMIGGLVSSFDSRLKEYILPFPEHDLWHDYWIAVMAACLAEVVHIPERLVKYRIHQSNQLGIKTSSTKRLLEQLGHLFSPVDSKLAIIPIEVKHRLHHLPLAPDIKELLENSASHATMRLSLPQNRLERISKIANHLYRGHYQRFSKRSYLSALQDIVMSSKEFS